MTTNTLRQAIRWHRPLMVFTAAMAVSAVVCLVGIFADPRVLTGAPIWLKPFKFSVSLGIYALTLAWMLSLLPRRSRVADWAGTVIAVMGLAEMVVIVTQVLRGTTSHFNGTTPLNGALFQAMGMSIMVLFVAHFVLGIAVLRRRVPDRVAARAVGLGLGLSLLGMLAAIPMVIPGHAPTPDGINGSHAVGVADGGPGLPIVGWSTTGGDLRIGHFIGLHALQALPLLAILLTRFAAGWDDRTKIRLLTVAGTAYGVLTAMLTWQALRGQPLLRPDGLTLAAAAALVLGAATAAGLVLAASRRHAAEPVPAHEGLGRLAGLAAAQQDVTA
ncbi:hypothetical protein ACFFWC_20355 [Plantactinospora siamensis]|uniref:Uncharacterized protein n=1 Tax=Plantactinospora siamensis TaxID=555372 RepID=A0ABV6P351_9ACTN